MLLAAIGLLMAKRDSLLHGKFILYKPTALSVGHMQTVRRLIRVFSLLTDCAIKITQTGLLRQHKWFLEQKREKKTNSKPIRHSRQIAKNYVLKTHVVKKPLNSIYRGSYMSAHVLLNLLNESGERDKM